MEGKGGETIDSVLKSASAESEWVKQIENILLRHLDLVHDPQLSPCIFQVPGILKTDSNPEAYTPQMVGLGPFHHHSQFHQLRGMMAIKRRFAEQGLRWLDLPDGGDTRSFAEQVVTPLLPVLRSNYGAHLDIPDPNLASILAIDFLFLVELLLADESPAAGRVRVQAQPIMDDVMMLENQIPIFYLVDSITPATQSLGTNLELQLGRVCRTISPLKLPTTTLQQQQRRPRHLLDFLYLHIVAGLSGSPPPADSVTATIDSSESYELPNSTVLQILETIPGGLLLRRMASTKHEIRDLAGFLKQSAPVRWIGSVLTFLEKAGLIGYADQFMRGEPLIPTASELMHGAGIKIRGSTLGAAKPISFERGGKVLRLPVFTWTPNCQALMRNLVAYELSMAGADEGPGILTRYVELMHALTAAGSLKEVKLLRTAGVIAGPPKHDARVAELFGKMIIGCPAPDSDTTAVGGGRRTWTTSSGSQSLDLEIQAVNRCYEINRKCRILPRRAKIFLRRASYVLLIVLVVGILAYPTLALVISTVSFDIRGCISTLMALLPHSA